jgi:colicin import membrane protein
LVKATEQNDKLNLAVIVSVVLHLILLAFLILGALPENIMSASISSGNGSAIGVVMVDPNVVVEQYNRQQQSNNAQHAEKLHQKKAQPQIEKLQQNQAAETHRLQALEKQRLVMQEKTAQQAKLLVKQQIAKADADKLALSQDEVQKKAVTAKQSAEVNNLFDGLSDSNNAPERGGKLQWNGKHAGQDDAKKVGASSVDINGYMWQIQGAIQSKFYDSGSFIGKTCDLRIKLAADGLLISVQEVGGDPALCQAAVSAAKLARMPKPPSDAVCQHFENFILGFKPQ